MNGQQKSPGLAAVLSFFITGLGQIYNGQIGKGIAFILINIVGWFVAFASFGLLGIPLFIFWVFNIYDAYTTAEQINRRAGDTLSSRACLKCGRMVPASHAFCPHCGNSLAAQGAAGQGE